MKMPFIKYNPIKSRTEIKFKNFDEMLVEVQVPILVDFYAEWCGPCIMMKPVLLDIANRLEDEAKVAKLDVDKSPRISSRYQVRM